MWVYFMEPRTIAHKIQGAPQPQHWRAGNIMNEGITGRRACLATAVAAATLLTSCAQLKSVLDGGFWGTQRPVAAEIEQVPKNPLREFHEAYELEIKTAFEAIRNGNATAKDYLVAGKGALNSGDYGNAATHISKAIQLDAKLCEEGCRSAGDAYFWKGDYVEAAKYYERAFELELAGDSYGLAGKHVKAIELFTKARFLCDNAADCTRMAGKLAESYRNLGDALMKNGKHMKAARAYGQSLVFEPGDRNTMLSMASALSGAKEYANAEAAYLRALNSGLDDIVAANVWSHIGNLRFDKEDYYGAMDAYRNGIALANGLIKKYGNDAYGELACLYINLAGAHMNNREPKSGLHYAQKALGFAKKAGLKLDDYLEQVKGAQEMLDAAKAKDERSNFISKYNLGLAAALLLYALKNAYLMVRARMKRKKRTEA